MFTKLMIILFVAILNNEALDYPPGRIIGGQTARIGQFPFAAAIHVETAFSKFFCGGALTGNDYVITSGHCVYNAVLFTIQLGSNQLDSEDSNRLTVATSTYIIHPDFKADTIENDIVYLSPVFPMEFALNDNAHVYTLGWGQTADDSELSNDLQFAFLTTISNLECRGFYGNQITDNMVCVSGNYNEGTCIGDTGSPLVASSGKSYALVGVSSFISSVGCGSIYPSGYTRTFSYLEWIRNNTRQ